MMAQMKVRRLGATDSAAMRQLNAVYADAFDDADSYLSAQPEDAWLARQLADPYVVAMVAERDGAIIGGLTGYVLPKLEQARSEFYIYDLAVVAAYRRQGVAAALIDALKGIARDCGAWVIYVQADYGDDPAIALYTKLGTREDVIHFDIEPGGARASG